jgi:hypothetical protein
MARVDSIPVRRRRQRAAFVGALAVAASVALAVGGRSAERVEAPRIDANIVEATAVEPRPAPVVVRERRTHAAAIVEHGARLSRAHPGGHDLVELVDGAIAVDARDREPVAIRAGGTVIAVDGSRADVVAHGGAIVSAHVFAGSVEIVDGERRVVLVAGETWTRSEPEVQPHVPTPAAVTAEKTPADPTAESWAQFRAGWIALHGLDYDAAIEAFDRASDAAAEEAAFWAAIAAERAGDRAGARDRLEKFLARFPSSVRADDARAALVRVTR